MLIHALVITYAPGDLDDLLGALALQCARTTIIDNTPGGADLGAVAARHGAELITLGTNVGIAAAQNMGIERALEAGADAVILFDQDSVPTDGMIPTLAQHLTEGVAAVGPVPREGDDVLVYTDHTFGPKRPATVGSDPFEVSFLLASGELISARALAEVGLMNAAWFIDHIDLEWGMRARRAGYRLLAVPAARLDHRLGDRTVKVPGRRVVHVHAPIRNYYLTRNTIRLISSDLLPLPWRVRYVYWIARFAAFNILVNPDRAERARYFARALGDGLRGRLGRW
ncbi:MAG: glycosyltransferase family 2 protein [Flaviflexus sp.]|nr:glycosyltransferase family 2 protein [Flaviflexus sp.]